jgi:serine/threonine protein kinase
MTDAERPDGNGKPDEATDGSLDETVHLDQTGAPEGGKPAGATPGGSPRRYELKGVLGEGGMAIVREAIDGDLDRSVAVKCLRPEYATLEDYRTRFLAEARVMAGLSHPGSIPVYECGALAGGELFFSMKKVQGKTFRDLLVARTEDEIRSSHGILHYIDIFERICQTMAAAHAERIIHRDLKPDNIMVDDFGAVYVMDWGIAKKLEPSESPSDSDLTRVGALMGTPAYMSPEQARGEAATSDRQTDVFSLGIILYEILTGTNPFSGEDFREALKGVQFHEPDPPRKRNRRVPRTLSAVCMKALNKDPFRRYRTAGELADDIRNFREFLPVSAHKPGVLETLYNWSRRRPVLSSVLGTLLLVAIVVGGGIITKRSVENRVVEMARERMQQQLAELEQVERQLALVREDLADPSIPQTRRERLTDELRDLEVRREVVHELTLGFSWGIMGLTFGSPDERARRFVHDDLLKTIETAIENREWVRARTFLDIALQSYERQNLFGFTEEEYVRMQSLREETDSGEEQP